MIQLTIIKLHPNEYIQGLHYYPFVVNLGRCTESCNTLDDLLNREWVPNKRERLNLNVFDIIIEINKWEILAEHYKASVNLSLMVVNVTRITINVSMNAKIQKNIKCAKKIISGILLHVVAKMINI